MLLRSTLRTMRRRVRHATSNAHRPPGDAPKWRHYGEVGCDNARCGSGAGLAITGKPDSDVYELAGRYLKLKARRLLSPDLMRRAQQSMKAFHRHHSTCVTDRSDAVTCPRNKASSAEPTQPG